MKQAKLFPLRRLGRGIRSVRSTWLVAVFLAASLGGHFAIQHIVTSTVKAGIVDEARATTVFLAASFERAANEVEAVLNTGIRMLTLVPDAAAEHELLQSAILPGAVVQLTLVGADGWSRASSQGSRTSVDLNDREHIRVHKDGLLGPHEMFVSRPILGRISGRWTIQFTKALRGPDDAFDGVLVASYAVEDFISLYSTFPMDKGYDRVVKVVEI